MKIEIKKIALQKTKLRRAFTLGQSGEVDKRQVDRLAQLPDRIAPDEYRRERRFHRFTARQGGQRCGGGALLIRDRQG